MTFPNKYKWTLGFIILLFIIYLNPIEKLMYVVPRYTLYYTKAGIKASSDGKQTTTVFDSSMKKKLGVGIFSTNSFKTDMATFDFEESSFCFNDTDAIHFTILSKDSNGYFEPGKYTYSISGGSGSLAGSKGYVVFNVSSDGLRQVSIYIS